MNFIEWFTEKAIPNNINRIFLYSELGGGKTTALKALVKKLVDNYTDYQLIPIYIDCREIDYENKVISKYIISEYCWISKDEIKNDYNRVDILGEWLLRNKYKYLIILDGTDLLSEDSIDKVYTELKFLCDHYSNLFIIFSNSNERRFNTKTFQNNRFQKKTLKPLDLYDDKVTGNNVEIQNLDYHTKEILSLPWFLSKYIKKKNTISQIDEFNLINNYVDNILETGTYEDSDVCFERKCLVKCNIAKLDFESKNGVIEISNYNPAKISDLSIFKCIKYGNNISKFVASHEFVHFYLCEEHLFNMFEKDKNEFLELINQKIIDDITLKLFGQRLKITNENRMETDLYKLINVIRSIDNKKQIEYSTALNNILQVFCLTCSKQLSDFDLSKLDLRLCCFIGVDCSGASFENSICTDECFVPIEPENANIFSISENGRYFITGDKDVLNIRETETNILIDKLLADAGNEFTDAESWGEDYFYVKHKNNSLNVTVKKDFVYCTAANNLHGRNRKQSLLDELPESITKYGNPLCIENGFVLVKTDANTIYGNAYLLFDLQTEKLSSVCKYHTHINISSIVQDGDEIEYLFENDGKPLKSICYNEKNKEVYRKEYSSLVGKGLAFAGGTKIYFNTDNIDSFLKWYFDCEFLKYRNLNEWFDKDNNYNFFIGECYSDPDLHLENKSCIKTKNYQFNLIAKGYHLLFIDKYLYYPQKLHIVHFEISSNDYMEKPLNESFCFYNFTNKKTIALRFDNLPEKFYALDSNNTNIFENKSIALGDSVVELDDKNREFVTVYRYNLKFSNEYINEIEHFPWRSVILTAMERYNDNITHDEFWTICKEIVLEEMLEDNYIWADVFGWYISCFIFFSKVKCLDENISDSDFVEGIKHWCCPCDDGVIYYNGKYSCYLRINDSGKADEIPFRAGACLTYFRNGVHYNIIEDKYNVSCFYKMYDICKYWSENLKDNIRIPIYDLKLFNANIEGIKGLSGVVTDIIKKQIEIETHKVIYND